MDSFGGGSSDDRWKLSKMKGRSRSGRPHNMDAAGVLSLSRSYSASVSSTRTTTAAAAAQPQATATTGSGSSSYCSQHHQAAAAAAAAAGESSSAASTSRNRKMKCVEAVKEHRARFYIVRRCVSMLVCWRDY